MRSAGHGLVAIAAVLLLSACGSDDGFQVVAGRGRAEAALRDAPAGTPSFSGTLVANTNAAVSVDGVTWHDLGSSNGITINLQHADSTTVHGEVDAPQGTFGQVGLILRQARATIRAGSVIGGETLANDVILTIGGGDSAVVILKVVAPFTIGTTGRTLIAFELNSESWVTPANVQDGVVDDAEVQQAMSAAVRSEGT